MTDEPEVTFEQMLAQVARPEGIGQFFKDEQGRTVLQTESDLVQAMADPRMVALVLRDIDENDDQQLSKPELATFFREVASRMKQEDTRDAQGNTIEGAPLTTAIEQLVQQMKAAPPVAQFEARLAAATDDAGREAVKQEFIAAYTPRIQMETYVAAGGVMVQELSTAFQAIARQPELRQALLDDADEADRPSIAVALNQIARYDLEHMDIPNAEEVFPSVAGVPNLRDSKTNDDKPTGREVR